MERPIDTIAWKRPDDTAFTDITDAIDEGVISATPHPDDDIDRPKGYSLKLVLKPESTGLASDLQAALMDMEPATVRLRMADVSEPIKALPVSVSKVPYPGEQNVAELGVKPDGHERLHPYF